MAAAVVSLAAGREPRLGATRLVCVDGPAGSGKTTLGREVAALVGAQLVNTDELMAGWRGLDAVARQLGEVTDALGADRAASYERWDWHADAWGETVAVPPGPWLVVEGVGSGARAIAARTTVLVWVSVTDGLRLARGLERDGAAMAPHWERFMLDERALFAAEGTEARADVLVDGTGARPPVIRAAGP